MIHREGTVSIILAIVVSGLLVFAGINWLPSIAWLLYILAAFIMVMILQFFRNPTRHIPEPNDNWVYAPADGKVVVIEKVFEPEYLKREALQVSIFMSPINVHVNRMPFSGKITYAKYHPGKYLVAWHPKSSTENERTSIAAYNGKHTVLMRQIAGALARRIKYYVKEGDMLQQGQEYGFIKFGSRVDLFLPLDTEVKVNLQDTVYGNQTVIAQLPS
jgi:phosphatidylserine decarboxylase